MDAAQKDFSEMIVAARNKETHPVAMLNWTWLYVFVHGMSPEVFEREYKRTVETCST